MMQSVLAAALARRAGGVVDLPGNLIDTDRYSTSLRNRLISFPDRAIRLTNFSSSDQSADLSEPPNCDGFGRVHRFEVEAFDDWVQNPLPIRPAQRGLGLPDSEFLSAQVFQNAGCNWRCWYCFVPYDDLTARGGELVPVEQMVEWDLQAHPEPHLIDLSGGQPDLTPEWAAWFVEDLVRRGDQRCFVWSDDNLSTDYLWRYLTSAQIGLLGEYPRYGRACCIKGYDANSFSFNTRAAPALFERQFELLNRMQTTTSIDFYLYLTITTPDTTELRAQMETLVDRLQQISEYLPLRTVPLKVVEWGPVSERMTAVTRPAMVNQFAALECWRDVVTRRFPGTRLAIEDVPR